MQNWKMVSRNTLGAAALSATIVMGSGVSGEAATAGVMSEVPVSDWSYSAVNELISAGMVPDYAITIPQGRIMSRMEMAMIVDAAMQNQSAMNATQQAELKKLNEAYYYDIKKVRMLSKLDSMDSKQTENPADSATFTQEEKTGLKKAAALVDKLSIDGYARIRNDHVLTNKGMTNNALKRSTIANMIQVAVDSTYKISDTWQAHTNVTYRSSLTGFDVNKIAPSENDSGICLDTFVTGTMPKLGLNAKIGKWNEWNIYGWGMDIDCNFSGAQFTYGKKALKTFLTMGQMDLWDNKMGGDRKAEKVTSLRFFYPFDKKNDINFGTSWSSAMASRYQNPDQGRVFYYYAHAHHKFDQNWDLRVGLINSNAERNNMALAGTKTKQPGRWIQVQYKGAKVSVPNSYGITLDYRYEPALSWPTVTDWCGLNEKFIRLGVSYVPTKNVLLETFYTWRREIDTDERDDMYRFQAQFFF